MAPIPLAMCGKVTPHAQSFAQHMLPEYEIVFRFSSVDEYRSSISALMRGEPVNPSTGIGTNTDNPNPRIPVAMFVGGGFSAEELQDMMSAPEAKSLPWINPGEQGRQEVRAKGDLMSREHQTQGPGKGMMEIVVGRVKECLRSHGIVEGNEGWQGHGGELWRS